MLKTLLFLALAAVAIVWVRSLIFGAVKRAQNKRAAAESRAPISEALPAAAEDAQRSQTPSESHEEPVASSPAAGEALTPNQVFMQLRSLELRVPDIEPIDPESADLPSRREFIDAFGTTLERVATEPRYAPRRPLLLPQLLRAVNDSAVSRREISNIIARDPALAGNLLKLANSSFYRTGPQAVESVDRAVALLGTEGIRSLIAAALIQPVFRSTHPEFAQFANIGWEHTFLSAAASESHAAVVENADPFAAQLLGLVMGLAELIVFRVALDQYAERAQRPDAAVIAHLLGRHAAQVARQVAASWDLSDRILTALDEQNPAATTATPTALGRSLKFGRLLAALATLNANGCIDDEGAQAVILATGAPARQFDRFWTRLTGRPSMLEPKPHRPPSTLAR